MRRRFVFATSRGRKGPRSSTTCGRSTVSTGCCWFPATGSRKCVTWPIRSASGKSTSARVPSRKLELVRRETERANTVFLGDGINDAPALTAATVGIAFGQNSDITAEAAGAVIMESSLQRVDEFLHISRRMRSIALQSAVGGMALSLVGMVLAAAGYLPPVAGAIVQEVIDVVAVVNALRVAIPPKALSDY